MSTTNTIIESPIGEIILVAEGDALTGLYFRDQTRRPDESRFGLRTSTGFERATAQLAEYFSGERTEFDLPLAPRGTVFQKRVWDLLRQIPYGETRSYGQLAQQLGNPGLAREVGASNGRNPIGVIVPCHRVIGADGRLVGYAGGLERKRFLLDLEAPVKAAQLTIAGFV